MSNNSVESSAEARLMSARRNIGVGLLLSLLTVGCAEVKHAPPAADATAALPVGQSAVKAESPVAGVSAKPSAEGSTPGPEKKEAPPSSTDASPVVVEPSATHPAKTSATNAESPVAKIPTKHPAEPRQQGAAPTPDKKETSPALDLTSLETRLRETKAIGLYTKIALKNQVDDLLNQFRAYYQGRLKTTLAELREPYNRLLLKVLSLLQDDDPALAHEIATSREAIWGILADPVKFATL